VDGGWRGTPASFWLGVNKFISLGQLGNCNWFGWQLHHVEPEPPVPPDPPRAFITDVFLHGGYITATWLFNLVAEGRQHYLHAD